MRKLIFLLLLSSCHYHTVRVEVVENNTVTTCNLTEDQYTYLEYGDTIWLDMSTHSINDTSDYAMKAVIK